jgi:OOP family OmpA-OmpF porin
MKQMILAAAILCCTVPAMAGDAYVGASVGRSNQSAHLGGFLIDHAGHATAYKLFGGYQFTPNFGIEGGLADLGKLAVEGGTVEGARTWGDVRPRSFYAAGTASLPLTDKFAVSGKLGVAATRLTQTISAAGWSSSESHGRASLLAGVGASYALNEKVSLVAEYENFGKVAKRTAEEVKAEMVSVGVRMKF